MTTTVQVSASGTVALPEAFRRRRKIEPGMGLRVTDMGEGILLTPVYPPSEE
jgi:bifunctional DNA-binding transcriptional regulator/antitoxin component of YhaV-PrlF toxin-antitoxin module